ncbi:MAG TPA: HAD-IA family hydrolase [Terracidiphilus sp.]|nr:HAD-IA family hydrolase [Terracidiphilus sp.]
MIPFDVILFDVGGVLLTNGWDHAERAAAVEKFSLDRASFEARHATVVDAWEKSEIALDAYLDAAVFNEPRPFTRDEFFAFMLTQSKLLPNGAIGILAELAASNQSMVGCLNNEARETNDYRFTTFGLRRYFKVAFSSCYVGLRKPHVPIYLRAIDILGVAPGRILFIDDRQENVDGAVQAGMTGIRFVGESALRERLKGLGVL